jgi:hypothetical protein
LLTATTASAQSLEQQAICAKQAKTAFEEYSGDPKSSGSNKVNTKYQYQIHYNTKLNKCFVDIQETVSVGKNITTGDTLMDAFEQRVYAQYVWASPQIKSCDLIPTVGHKKTCSTKDEYDAFVAKYMEE